jgi:hypothetical protein
MKQSNQGVGTGKVRTVRSEEQVLAILEEFERSGFTAKEYCAISDLNEATFYSWLRKYRQRGEEEIKGFAAVEGLTAVTSAKPALFAEGGAIRLYKEVSTEYLKPLLA